MKRYLFLLPLLLVVALPVAAQFTVNGSAAANGPNCYTLTPALNSQSGSVWHTNLIDLTQSFEFSADIFLGCNNGGADGMVFAFQSVSTSVGSLGGGMGYAGITPSIAVEFDTYQNGGSGDPSYDHCAIISQGNVSHTAASNLAGPVGILPSLGNVEDCQWHSLHISWNPVTDSFRVYIDCNLRLTYVGDIPNTIFGGNPMVFWGFTAGTGALNNQHQFCYNYISYGLDTTICQGDTVPLTVGGGATYAWSPATGLTDPSSPTPLASPNTTTQYACTITDVCGFQTTEYFNVTVNDTLAAFTLGLDTTLCQNDSFLRDMTQSGASYLWQDNSTDSVFTVKSAGLYWVELRTGCDTIRDSLTVLGESVPIVNLGPDPTLCEGDSVWLDASAANADAYLWQDGSDSSHFQLTAPGLIWAELNNQCGSVRDSLQVTYLPIFTPPDLGPDTLLCDAASLSLSIHYPGATYLWSNNATGNSLTVTQPGLYWVNASNLCSSVRDSINVMTELSPQVDLGEDSTLCLGQTLQLDASWTPMTDYTWQDNTVGSSFTLNQPGLYWVELQNACGQARDSILVDYLSPPPGFSLGRDSTICQGDELRLESPLLGYDLLWSDASTGIGLTVQQPGGLYWLELGNRCGTSRDSIRYGYLAPPTVDLGPDEVLCEGETRLLDVTWPGASYAWSDGRQTPIRFVNEAGLYAVIVSNQCGSAQSEVNYSYVPTPRTFSLGPDQRLCWGETLSLVEDQGPAFVYRWQDGSNGTEYTVSQAGSYSLRISNECGTQTDEIAFTYLGPPAVDLGNDTIVCTDRAQFITLDATLPREANYLWQDGSTEAFYRVETPGNYHVTLTNDCGVASDTVLIEPTRCFCAIHAPTGFTPNGDGLNDAFQLFYDCQIVAGTFRVYNRWGVEVFASTDPNAVWPGTYQGQACAEGVYIWVMDFTYTEADRSPVWIESGTVTLVR